MFFLLLKICFFCIFAIVIRGSLPRHRIDQIVVLNWKQYLFILIFNLILISIFIFVFSFYF